ncbi:HEPN domain-containing protein [Roseovarius tibetensis]|uniref:ApeA N-terminal domain 1-containing protein n=1 Tax=Roseovarius tibetensis TaxID=2685897 RepID=UPI003D7FCFD0
MLEGFEEWFAIRNRHCDDDIWPGKLKFSEDTGITLEAICHLDSGNFSEAPCCEKGTITGYLDYQRPTTIIDPWVQSQGGGSIGVDTPVMRAKSRILASAVLKNINLEDPNEKCFTALNMDMPSFSAWYAPQLVKSDYEHLKENKFPTASVEIDHPTHEQFTLNDEKNATVRSLVETRDEEGVTKVVQRTFLKFEFPSPVDYATVQAWIWRVNTLFSFLLGCRMAQNPYQINTTHTRKWNGEDEQVTAELFFHPIFKSKVHHVKWYDALFMRHNCALTAEELLNATSEQSEDLFYLMNMVLRMEKPEKLSASDFSELVGCIEDFDIKVNGSGSSRDVRAARKKLRKVVKDHGDDSDIHTLDELTRSQPNRLTLAERLGRLQQNWSDSGFQGSIDIDRIKKIRNDVSHGRGVDLSVDDYQEIVWLNYNLCAMARFHVLRTLGIEAEAIGAAFRRLGFRYRQYAPAPTSDT